MTHFRNNADQNPNLTTEGHRGKATTRRSVDLKSKRQNQSLTTETQRHGEIDGENQVNPKATAKPLTTKDTEDTKESK